MARPHHWLSTPARRLYFVRAFGSLAIAVAITALLFIEQADETGMILGGIIIALFLGGFVFNLVRALRTSPKRRLVVEEEIVKRLPVESQIGYYRRCFWVGTIVSTFLIVWMTIELARLESGKVDSVRMVVPFNIIYDTFGFWPTVISAIALVGTCCGSLQWKIRRLSKQERAIEGEDMGKWPAE